MKAENIIVGLLVFLVLLLAGGAVFLLVQGTTPTTVTNVTEAPNTMWDSINDGVADWLERLGVTK